jgi:hypothetical protein
VELLDERPGSPVTNQFYIPPGKSIGQDGMLVHIIPDATGDWIGCFAFGDFRAGLSAVIASPQPEMLLVIARGAGYLVNTARPSEWKQIPCVPVRDARVLLDHRLVIFADFTRLAAYGTNGLARRSQPLCADDLRIIGIAGAIITGSGYDPTNPASPEGRFELDLLTGVISKTNFECL